MSVHAFVIVSVPVSVFVTVCVSVTVTVMKLEELCGGFEGILVIN